MKQAREAFVSIYATHEWKGKSLSGPGSDEERTEEFRSFLSSFLRSHQIGSVTDCGCGDWSYARLMDWTGIQYTGVDVVPDVITRNREQYSRPNISFECVDADATKLPPADLFLCKEVLQHLPSQRVHEILSIAANYKFGIIVNDIAHDRRRGWRHFWRWMPESPVNVDISPGGYRLLSLRDSPFNLKAKQVLVYPNRFGDRRWIKEVLAWTPDASAAGMSAA